MGSLPMNTLPPGTQLPAAVDPYAASTSFVRKSPDGKHYATNVGERIHKRLNIILLVTDTRILDSNGRFIKQFGSMSPRGWLADGSLLVTKDYRLLRIDASEIE